MINNSNPFATRGSTANFGQPMRSQRNDLPLIDRANSNSVMMNRTDQNFYSSKSQLLNRDMRGSEANQNQMPDLSIQIGAGRAQNQSLAPPIQGLDQSSRN